MSISSVFFTNKGKILQAKAQTGTPLHFTRIALGDGELQGQAPQTFNTLVNEKLSIDIIKLVVSEDGTAKVGGGLNNSSLTTGFYYRELGLFVQDPDNTDQEILYCYGNAGALAEYIPAQGSELIEKKIDIIAIIGNATKVSATINSSLIGLGPEDLELHDKSPESHQPIRQLIQTEENARIQGDSQLDSKIKNLSEQVKNLDVSWDSGISGKPEAFPPSSHSHAIAEVSGLQNALDEKAPVHTHPYAPSSHTADKNNPHRVTKSQVGLGSVNNWGASSAVNDPSTTTYATTSGVKQAYDRANEAFQSASNGKTKIASAITGKGVTASASDTFATLASKIGSIVTGNITYKGEVKYLTSRSEAITVSVPQHDVNKTVIFTNYFPAISTPADSLNWRFRPVAGGNGDADTNCIYGRFVEMSNIKRVLRYPLNISHSSSDEVVKTINFGTTIDITKSVVIVSDAKTNEYYVDNLTSTGLQYKQTSSSNSNVGTWVFIQVIEFF